jgi:hypothetical protein
MSFLLPISSIPTDWNVCNLMTKPRNSRIDIQYKRKCVPSSVCSPPLGPKVAIIACYSTYFGVHGDTTPLLFDEALSCRVESLLKVEARWSGTGSEPEEKFSKTEYY